MLHWITSSRNISSNQYPQGYAKLWGKKLKPCHLKKLQSRQMIFSIDRVAQSKSLWPKSIKYPPSHPPPRPQLSRRRQLQQHLTQPPSVMKTKRTSTLSTEVVVEDSTEPVAATEAKEAAVGHPSTDNRAPRRTEILLTTTPRQHPPHPSHQTPAAGIVASGIKQGSVIRNVLFTNHSPQPKSRETAREDGACERGHPLLLIIKCSL